MSPTVLWTIGGIAAASLEMFTGTFYLLLSLTATRTN